VALLAALGTGIDATVLIIVAVAILGVAFTVEALRLRDLRTQLRTG
jgi:hypothetical protein